MSQLSDILINSEDSGDVLRKLAELSKSDTKGFSLEKLRLALGYSSKGNLSEILHGRRRVPKKMGGPLSRFFKLGKIEKQIFLLILERDRLAKDSSKAILLNRKLFHLRRSLSARATFLPDSFYSVPYFFEVFCLFGFSDAPIDLDFVLNFFSSEQRKDVVQAWNTLIEVGAVAKAESGGFRLVRSQIMTSAESQEGPQLFIKSSINHALENFPAYVSRKEEAIFSSSLISVSKLQYQMMLQSIREDLEVMQDSLDSTNADMIVRFNVQIYPATYRE